MSSSPKVLFGFHAVGVRLKTAPKSVLEVFYDASRRDARMRQFLDRTREAGVRLIESDGLRLAKMCGSHGHQGVVARVEAVAQVTSLDELLEQLEASGSAQPLLNFIDHREFAGLVHLETQFRRIDHRRHRAAQFGNRFAQIGITLELEDAKTAEQVKLHLPTIRSGILMLVSQRTSAELLVREGKEKLAADIRREVSRPLGYSVPTERERARAADAEQDGDAEDRPARKRTERNPVLRVLFSNFIIQ